MKRPGEEPPVVLATRYLMEQWKKRHGIATPPLGLASAVTRVVLVAGCKKANVDALIVGYEKRLAEESAVGSD